MTERHVDSTRAPRESPSLWLLPGSGDLQIVRLLLAADDAKADAAGLDRAAAELYAAAFARRQPREVVSIQEHLDFLAELTGAGEARPQPVREALAAVRRSM